MKTKTLTANEVQEATGVDQVTKSKGVYTARVGFYYRHGKDAAYVVRIIQEAFPEAKIEDSGEVWKPFNGGASVARQSHWFVKFTL